MATEQDWDWIEHDDWRINAERACILELRARVEALEHLGGFAVADQPVQVAPAPTDDELIGRCWGKDTTLRQALRSAHDLGRAAQHHHPEQPDADPAPTPTDDELLQLCWDPPGTKVCQALRSAYNLGHFHGAAAANADMLRTEVNR